MWPQHDQRSIEVYRRGAWLCTAIPHNAFALVLVGGNGTWRVLSAALLLGPVAHGLSSGLL